MLKLHDAIFDAMFGHTGWIYLNLWQAAQNVMWLRSDVINRLHWHVLATGQAKIKTQYNTIRILQTFDLIRTIIKSGAQTMPIVFFYVSAFITFPFGQNKRSCTLWPSQMHVPFCRIEFAKHADILGRHTSFTFVEHQTAQATLTKTARPVNMNMGHRFMYLLIYFWTACTCDSHAPCVRMPSMQ